MFLERIRQRFFPPVSRLALRLRKEGLTYLTIPKLTRIEAELARLAQSRISGEYLEFGVALGGSGILIARAARAAGHNFSGFDVFAMIPPPLSDKDDLKSRERYAQIEAGEAKGLRGKTYYGYVADLHGAVMSSFARHGVPVDGQKISLVKGLFEETWPLQPARPIAFAHIDCDWYDPVIFCLNAVAERIVPGGAIVLDDYNDYGGCRTATEEFLALRRDFRRIEGSNLILRRLED